nr:hypothetical protein [Streptomyces sp. E5N91]
MAHTARGRRRPGGSARAGSTVPEVHEGLVQGGDARFAVPIHYEPGQPDKIAGYEVTDPEAEFRAHAGRRAHVLAVGEWLDLAT